MKGNAQVHVWQVVTIRAIGHVNTIVRAVAVMFATAHVIVVVEVYVNLYRKINI